jgi:hypothetical protein
MPVIVRRRGVTMTVRIFGAEEEGDSDQVEDQEGYSVEHKGEDFVVKLYHELLNKRLKEICQWAPSVSIDCANPLVAGPMKSCTDTQNGVYTFLQLVGLL